MRKAVAILAFSCLLFLTSGYQLFYLFRLAEAKCEMKERLLQSTPGGLTRFVFQNDELKNLEWEGRSEFRFQGEMYDVFKMTSEAGKTVIWCVADKKETAILEHYLQTQKQTSEHTTSSVLLKLLGMQFLPCAEVPLSTPDAARTTKFAGLFLPLPTNPVFILTPPPRVC